MKINEKIPHRVVTGRPRFIQSTLRFIRKKIRILDEHGDGNAI